MNRGLREFPAEQKLLELGRKGFHTLIGLCATTIFLILGRYYAVLILVSGLLIGVAISEFSLRGRRILVLTDALLVFDRPEDIRLRPGFGVFTFLTGFVAMIALPFLPGLGFLLSTPAPCSGVVFGHLLSCSFLDGWGAVTLGALLVASLSDSAATVFGVYAGRHPWPHNWRKSLEGSLANFAFGVLALWFVVPLWVAVPTALVVAAVETLPKTDDNLNIPLVAAGLVTVFLWMG